ncbi:MAG: hypothetical protein CMJ25_15950 [Phycisphaerae bacterium]|nr:hypothetical protein [Phycisphaerae bacterium]|tara:strand:- start:4626 stop:5531 length:906 start_codon:yes stop_codon:yes gene_type:complete
MSEQAEYEKYLGDLFEMEQKYLRERYPEDFEEQDRLDALEDARDEDGNVTFRDVAKLGLMGVMLGGQKLGFNMGPVWESIKGKGFALGGVATATKGITTQEGKDMAAKKFQRDDAKADTNEDGELSTREKEVADAVQKNEVVEMYHGGMACGCEGDCDGSCGGMMDGIMGYDEVSGNPIPIGSHAENVRDDIDAKLSTDEYVLPAHVVKWHGLKHIQMMQSEAEMGLMSMQMTGLIQHAEMSDAEVVEDEEIDEPEEGVDIEVATVQVDDLLDDEEAYEEEASSTSKLPGMLKKQKYAFAI